MIDFTVKGTKLPTVPAGTEYWFRNHGIDRFSTPKDYLVSFGKECIGGQTYIAVDRSDYSGNNFWYVKLWDIEQLAKEQGMLSKELPKYWVVKCDKSHPDWMKVIDYLNKIANIDFNGQSNNLYYGYDGNSNPKNNGTNCWDNISSFENNPTLLTIDEFMELTNQKEELSELPKYWVVKCDNSHPDWVKVIDYLNTIYGGWTGNGSKYYGYDGDKSRGYGGTNSWKEISSFENNPTVLTIDEFVKLISKEKIMKKITITREQLEEIYNIACETWKVKIKNIAQEQPFGDITLTQAQVDEMFKAATKDQLPVLEDIFGKPLKELDFRVDIDEKVDGLPIFGGLEVGHTQAFIVLPNDNTEDKNRFYLNPKYNWELEDNELIVTRK
jgi:hypothetical protein